MFGVGFLFGFDVVWCSQVILVCVYCWELLLSGFHLKKNKTVTSNLHLFQGNAPPPAATRWCLPCQLAGHRNLTGTVELDRGNGWLPKQGGSKVLAAVLLSSKAIWSIKFQWLHRRAWVSWLLLYWLSTKYSDNSGRFVKWFFKYSHQKPEFCTCRHYPALPKILLLMQTPLHSRRRWQSPQLPTPPIRHRPGTRPQFQDSVCLTFSLLISTFPHSWGLPTSPAALTFFPPALDWLPLPWLGPRSSLSSSLTPPSTALGSPSGPAPPWKIAV